MTEQNHTSLLEELENLERTHQGESSQAHRRFQRFSIRGIALIEPVRLGTGNEMQTIALRDLSLGGLGYLGPSPLLIDTVWSIDFLDDVYRIGQENITIRFCNMVRDNVYLIGGQFCAPMGLMSALGVEPRSVFSHDDAIVSSDARPDVHRDVA